MSETIDHGNKPTILAVDDTSDDLMQIHRLLADEYQVRVAISAGHALLALEKPPLPDLVLLDVMMPEIDGYELCRRLKVNPATREIPVIFLTGMSDADSERRGLEIGAVDYIAKPISPPILHARVRNHVALYQRTRKLNRLSAQLSRYLAPQIFRSIFEGSSDASLSTRRKKLTILFVDIIDFTQSTENMEPEDLTWLLNSYFAEMSRIAIEHGGTIDNLIGDAMIIFFGDPKTLGVERDAFQCVKMAVAMQRRMTELHDIWRKKGYDKSFQQRIGIHTGYCSVGNFGSELRMSYTAIGQAVNLAARLQRMGEPGEILISYETHALIQEFVVAEERHAVQLGISRPVRTYAVVGFTSRQPASGKGQP